MLSRLRWPISLAVLAAVIMIFEPARLAAEVKSLNPGWLLLALVITALQTLLSAWRWRFTAARLDLDLPWRRAIGDYYLAGFANQTLPGGVLGDIWRAQRHAEGCGRRGSAWRAVLIERGSGQVLVVVLSLISLLILLGWNSSPGPGQLALPPGAWLELVGTGALAAALVAGLGLLARRIWRSQWDRFRTDVRRALLAPDVLPAQLIGSLMIVASYALVFALAARAIGVDLPLALLLSIALPVLLAMLIPLSVAGWGWREAMAAGLWLSLGLPPEQGIAVSLAYGAIVALGTTPGLIVWLLRPDRSRQANRSADRHRESNRDNDWDNDWDNNSDNDRGSDQVSNQDVDRMSTSTTSSSPSG